MGGRREFHVQGAAEMGTNGSGQRRAWRKQKMVKKGLGLKKHTHTHVDQGFLMFF